MTDIERRVLQIRFLDRDGKPIPYIRKRHIIRCMILAAGASTGARWLRSKNVYPEIRKALFGK